MEGRGGGGNGDESLCYSSSAYFYRAGVGLEPW